MALFTDTTVITLDDLLSYEATLAEIASPHGINVETKIRLASSAMEDKVMLWLLDAGVSDPQFATRRQIGLSTVVVTPIMRRWLSFESLSRFYAEAYNIQLNPRFQGKWAEYQQESEKARDLMVRDGIGIVYHPLPAPSAPQVTVGAGTLAAQSLFVQAAWVDAGGAESEISAVNGLLLNDNSGVTVSMTETGVQIPSAATGWNVYLSSSQTGPALQNSTPLALGSNWTLPAGGVVMGPPPTGGQKPDFYVPIGSRIRRG
ncbi:MAG TPA: hypothetical protein VH369_19805 [Bryobacteraceae bacterium]|jgi:hypothetical protein